MPLSAVFGAMHETVAHCAKLRKKKTPEGVIHFCLESLRAPSQAKGPRVSSVKRSDVSPSGIAESSIRYSPPSSGQTEGRRRRRVHRGRGSATGVVGPAVGHVVANKRCEGFRSGNGSTHSSLTFSCFQLSASSLPLSNVAYPQYLSSIFICVLVFFCGYVKPQILYRKKKIILSAAFARLLQRVDAHRGARALPQLRKKTPQSS